MPSSSTRCNRSLHDEEQSSQSASSLSRTSGNESSHATLIASLFTIPVGFVATIAFSALRTNTGNPLLAFHSSVVAPLSSCRPGSASRTAGSSLFSKQPISNGESKMFQKSLVWASGLRNASLILRRLAVTNRRLGFSASSRS